MSRIYELGPFQLDAGAGLLTRAGLPVALGPRGVAVLRALVERANEYVSKASIIEAAWPGVVVEEGNLAVQIAALRRVLAQAGGADWVETLPRRGYRFVGPVKEFIQDRRPEGAGVPLRSNLPASLTSFIGRERELAEIKRLLASRRLVAIVGAGGIGKTRLALQVAAELVDAYRDGVWLAELGAIRDPSLVATTVAQALGVRESVGSPITDSMRAYLRPRQVLLVLDNCEHLLTACAKLTDILLQDAKQLTVIATAREPLGIAGEQSYPLHPLSLPERGSKFEAMRQSEAVQLFVERVQRQLPDFELTPDRAPAVAELCIHLDGIPLALELAAARARSLSVEQINARLGDRFRLLTGGSRTALPRQQTLRATLDWSYDLLAEKERVVLRRLSIFPGSFTVEAASAVACDAKIDEFAVLDVLSHLVARSLVIADPGAGRMRYRLLETTRAYAVEVLARVEETQICRRRHAEHYRSAFEHSPDDYWLWMPDSEWRTTYVQELDNVRVALDWALAGGGDPELAIRLSAGSVALWWYSGVWSEGVSRLQAAAAAVGPTTSQHDQAHLWFGLGTMLGGRHTEVVAAYERATDLYRRTGDVPWIGYSLMRVGAQLMFLGRTQRAATLLDEAGPLLERAGLPKALADYFLHMGTLKWFKGDLTGAKLELEKSAVLCAQSGNERSVNGVRALLAEIAWTSGDVDAALARYREAVAHARREARHRMSLGRYLTNLAGVHVERGELDAALAAAREGLPFRRETGDSLYALDHLALRMALTGRFADAARIAGHADHGYAAKLAERQPNEARARERLRVILRENLSPEKVERLLREGATMSEDEACRLALEH